MNNLYELKNVEKFYDDRKVLSIKHLCLEDNKIIGFFGPNGSGKSTLFSLLSFIDKQTKGKLTYRGLLDRQLDIKMKQAIVMVPQNPYLLKRTVFENVAYGLELRGETKNMNDKVLDALKLVGLDSSFSQRKWSQLSGGEIQRVALAARLILKPKVLILDEPTTGVDTNSAQLIKEAILYVKQKYNTTILISSHDHTWLNHICDTKIALFQGELVESGSINLLFAPWEKDKNGNLVKVFFDNQKLVIPKSKDKKRDSVLMINSNAFTLCRVDCDDMINDKTLNGVIKSVSQQSLDDLDVGFSIGDVIFSCKITSEEMKKQRLFPGDKVNINIDLQKVCWI